MKITKINTKMGQFGAPVSTELSAIVERMRSEKTQEKASRIAAIALKSRLMMQEGSPRFFLKESDLLPYLIFTATFGRSNLSKPIGFTGLVMLSIPCPEGIRQVAEMRRRVSQIPYTSLAFAGVSGVTLKVIVRCEYESEILDTEDYTAFLRDAHEGAARLYTSLAQCDLLVSEEHFLRGCRMSYDPQLYYNPKAVDCIYWFTSDDEREIQLHNSMYQQESAPEMILSQIFEPTEQRKHENFWTTTAIQKELGNHGVKPADIPNLTNLGKAIKKLRWQRVKTKNDRGYYLRLRKSAS